MSNAPERTDTSLDVKVASSVHAVSYACLVVLLSSLSVGIIFVGSKYAFKDELHLTPAEISYWNFIIDLPLLFSIAFGLLRDKWQPFGIADRPYLFSSSIIICTSCIFAGAMQRSLHAIILLLVIINVSAMLGAASMNGMLAELSKRFGISGRVSVASNLIPRFLAFLLLPLAGRIVQKAGFFAICYTSAALALSAIILAFYRPSALFSSERSISTTSAPDRESWLAALGRLLTNRTTTIAAVVYFAWEFDPGWRTPLFYHYTNVLGFSASQFELTNSIGAVGSLLASLLYGFLCFKIKNRKLIVISVVVALVACAAIGIVRSFPTAVAVSCIVGLSTGLGDAGVMDLIYRASSWKLESSSVLLGTAGGVFAADLADVVGTRLYEHGGLLLALLITFVTNLLILPLIWYVPNRVFSTLEGTSVIGEHS